MSATSDPVNSPLSSGIYIIHCVQDSKEDERLILSATSSSGDVTTEKDQIFKWKVVYYENDHNYTIEEADTNKFVVTEADGTRNDVSVSTTSQRFRISSVTYKKAVYYEIITTDGDGDDITFMCLGKGKQATAVPLPDSPNSSIIWDFEELSPYTRSPVTDNYFEKNQEGKTLDRFGLRDQYTWKQLWDGLDDLNKNAHGKSFYKLFFLGRHGNDEHNVKNKLQTDYEGFDAELTQLGYVQAGHVRSIWDRAQSEPHKIGLPQLSFCSPMRRALVTNTITFSSELEPQKSTSTQPRMKTEVVEDCRERCYIDNSEQRHPRHWIQIMFPDFVATELSETDRLWDPTNEEPFPKFRARARAILDRVFMPKKKPAYSVKFVSITAHHEWSAVFMEVLGEPGAMDKFSLEEGGVLPVIVQFTP